MSSVAADATDNVGGEVFGVRAVVLAVTDFTAVLASLVLVVTESTVESSQLTQLVALELVLTFGNGGSLRGEDISMRIGRGQTWSFTYRLNDLVNEFLRFDDLFLGIGHNQAVQILILVAGMSSVRLALTLLDRALSADRDLGLRFGFHVFQSVTTGTDE